VFRRDMLLPSSVTFPYFNVKTPLYFVRMVYLRVTYDSHNKFPVVFLHSIIRLVFVLETQCVF
jgi:hypothetical protein